MNDLDDLRHALHSPPGFVPRALDLEAIMTRGGRLRARRRLATSAAAAVSVVAVLIGGGLWVNHDRAGGPATIAPAGPGPAASPRLADDASAAPDPTPAADDDHPLGTIVRTGLTSGRRDYVLYAVPVNQSVLPDVHFGVMLGLQAAGAPPESKIVINETAGRDRSPGFHTGEAATNVDGADTPAFGYFVGPAARITATVHGRRTSAHLAAWSEDPQVIFFWFDLTSVAPGVPVTDLTATDRAGRKLATTTSGFGAG